MRTDTGDALDINAFLSELSSSDRPLTYIPNSGNAGDALIGHATFRTFARAGVNIRIELDYKNADPGGETIICSGGGNLVPLYDRTAKILEWASGKARRIIILPHTIRGNEELLAGLGPEVDLICREVDSFDHVRTAVKAAHVHIADDMAFSLDAQQVISESPDVGPLPSLYIRRMLYKLTRPSFYKTVPSPTKFRRGQKLIDARLAECGPGGIPEGTLRAFRTDVESTAAAAPTGSRDIAKTFSHGTKNALVCQVGSFHMMSYLNTFDSVETDRLHVSIAAALLGKKVTLWANSYRKNQAVFEYSMAARYPNVTWAGDRLAGDA